MKNQIFSICTLCATLFGIQFSTARPTLAGAEGHGGDSVAVEGRLYSLDLMEWGIEKNAATVLSADFDKNLSQNHPAGTYIFTAYGDDYHGDYVDDAQHSFFNSMIAASNDIFGYARTGVKTDLDTDTESRYVSGGIVTVQIANKVAEIGIALPKYAEVLKQELKKLTWMMVNIPLMDQIDRNSFVPYQFIVRVADRREGIVRISQFGWNKPISINGQQYDPMDRHQKTALITHELIYSITEAQGDVTSDRARRANALLYFGGDSNQNIVKSCRAVFGDDSSICQK